MRWMGTGDAYRYDRFKDQLFGKRKDQLKQKYRKQNKTDPLKPSHDKQFRPTKFPFFRKVIFGTIFITGLYFANEQFKLGHQIVSYLDNYAFHPIQKATIFALGSDIIRRLSINPQHRTLSQNKNCYFSNVYFTSQLNLLLKNLSIQNVPKTLSEEISSRVTFGPFRFGNRFDKLFINKNGHVVRQSKKSKVNIGGISFVGQKVQQVVEFHNTLASFDEQVDIQKSCRTINTVNKLFLSTEQYDKIYSQCVTNSSQIYRKINQKVKKQKAKFQKNNKLSRFIVSS